MKKEGFYQDSEEGSQVEVVEENNQDEIMNRIEESDEFKRFMEGFEDLCLEQQNKTQGAKNKLRFSIEEEKYLMVLIKRGYKEAHQAMMLLCYALELFIVKCVLNYTKTKEHDLFADMVSEGIVGLMESVNRYDLNKSVKLITYSSHWIKYYLREYFYSNTKMTHLPNNLFFRYRSANNELLEKLGRKPDENEIASKLDIPVLTVQSIQVALRKETSLDDTYSFSEGGEVSPYDFLVDDFQSAEDDSIKVDAREKILTILGSINPEYRYVLLRRSGSSLSRSDIEAMVEYRGISGLIDVDSLQKNIDGEGGSTLAVIGVEMGGISRERVRQIEGEARIKVKELFKECGIEGLDDIWTEEGEK